MEKVIIELQIEYELPTGLSYAEKVQYAENLELPTGYVEDSFGIVKFKKDEFPICYKCGRETDSVNEYLYCPECESREMDKASQLDGTLCRNGKPIDECRCC